MTNEPEPIRHIVVLMMENNSFDRMLGAIPGVGGVNSANLKSNPDFPIPSHLRLLSQRKIDWAIYYGDITAEQRRT